jgi:hypothetical protein
LAALLFSAVASASGPAVPVLPDTAISRGLLTNPWTIADLDGDHSPDLAKSSEVGMGVHGHVYRVEFQLSGELPNRPFTVSTGNHLGLNIVPRDIDGDSDLDLVITTGVLHQPVGVWLNDGKGAFTRADDSLYPAQDGTQGPGLSETHREQSTLPASNAGRRTVSIIPESAPLWRLKIAPALLQNAASAPSPLDQAGKKKSRAPPQSLRS